MAKVLVVDDDADMRDLLGQRLGRRGHDVRTAASAADALTTIERHGEPDIAVLDLVMPGVDGIELLDRLRDVGCARMSAVFVTARLLDSDLMAAGRRGAGYLAKPFAFAALTDAIEQVTPAGGR